jgi:putative glycosyltransferase (TIGR04372 family)
VPPETWFVGLHVRESGFITFDHLHEIRNADITTFEKALRLVVARGGWVIRMGNPGMKPLSPMPQVIDYAHSNQRSDWMDVFLCGASRFFIGTQSGLSQIATTFGVPTVITNWISYLTPSWGGQNLVIFKRCWSKRENRFLTFEEVMRAGLGYAQHCLPFLREGIRIDDNTAEEIAEVVEEMLERVAATARYTEEDRSLQDKYTRLAQRQGVVVSSRVGRDFLRRHAALFS